MLNLYGFNLIVALTVTVVNSVLMCFVAYKFFQIVQLSNYKVYEYARWLKDTKAKWISRIGMLTLLSLACMMVVDVLFDAFQQNNLIGDFGFLFYVAFIIIFIVKMLKVQQKTPLVLTVRMWRMILTFFVLMFVFSFCFLSLTLNFGGIFRLVGIALTPLLIPFLVPLSLFIMVPLEELIKKVYILRASKKLKGMPSLIKIGITGSYGKTSTKNFLYEILSKNFKVCASPKSYNTSMGITKTILNDLKPDDQILIAEMGATQRFDIKKICDFVKPNIAILTTIGAQHLETFKTVENIKATKFELIEALKPNDFAVFSGDSAYTTELYNKCDLKNKELIGKPESKIFATDVILTKEGTKFNLHIEQNDYNCFTKLFGEQNIQDILLAVSVAHYLKIDDKIIVDAILNLQPILHRLELKQSANNILILDDSFNSNILGTKYALKVLSLFNERRKIVVTPGLVELGEIENKENYEFGKRISKVADIVIIVNKNQSENIKKGLLDEGFKMENIYLVDNLYEVSNLFKTLLKDNDIVLFENDLPDNYR